MKIRFRKLWPVIFLVFVCCCLGSATSLRARGIGAAQWQQLKNEKALNYKNDVETAPVMPKNDTSGMMKAISSFFSFLLGPAGTTLVWIIVIIAVIYIVARLAGIKGSFLFRKEARKRIESVSETNEDDIAGTDWQLLMLEAVKNGDQRQAARYRYMWLLQLLQQKELILYRTDKTNSDYYHELTDQHYKQIFRKLSRFYEYAWYGNYELSAAASEEYNTLFDQMKKQLGR